MKPIMVMTTTLSLLALGAIVPGNGLTGARAALASEPTLVAAGDDQGVSTITLDASSLSTFEASLAKMKASLSTSDKAKLSVALDKLLATTMEPAAGGDMTAPTTEEPAKSRSQTLYEKLGDRLDGKTFGDIVAMTD